MGQVRKALAEIGFDQYSQAEQTGWVLYLEGSTDLAILQAFAERLGKTGAVQALERPFMCYVGNSPSAAARHFHGLREARPDLQGEALFDRLDRETPNDPVLRYLVWKRRAIENYLCTEATLEAYARASATAAMPMPLFTTSEVDKRLTAMNEAVTEVSGALETLGKGSPWDSDVKASDDFLTPLFRTYFKKLGIPNLLQQNKFHELADYVPDNEIDPEIGEKLDAIAGIEKTAMPMTDG